MNFVVSAFRASRGGLLLITGLLVATLLGCTPAVEDPASSGTSPPPPAAVTDDEPSPAAVTDDEPSPHTVAVADVDEQAIADPGPRTEPRQTAEPQEPVEQAPGPEEAASKELTLDERVIVTWLPEPIANPDAEAASEAAMKPYTEKIPLTDASFEMVPIPGGKFLMGSPEDEEGRSDDEGPQHEVVVEPFWMGKYEVTWDEYELWAMGLDAQRRQLKHRQEKTEPDERELLVDALSIPTKPYSDMTFGMGKEGYPAICMTQLAARQYCKWLSAKTGRFYRLPTEAEWEYACRAGTTTAYSFGDDPEKLDEYAWYFDNAEDGYQKVGQKEPNPWGLHDMHGNAREWCLDRYTADIYGKRAGNTTVRPFEVPTTLYPRVARGGCWDDDPEALRSAARSGSNKDWRMQDPQIPQSIWYLTEVYCPGIRLVRPLKVPDAEEARLYEPDVEAMKEYKEAQAGKL